MTPTQLNDTVRQLYNAVGDSFYSDNELYNHMYAAHLEFARETMCINRVYTTTSVASQQEYAMPTNTISIKRVTYDGSKLKPISMQEDDSLTGLDANTTSTGRPRFYFQWGESIYLREIPDTDGLQIKIFTYNEPQVITNTSTFEIPTQFHMATCNYILSQMLAKDKDFNAATYYRNLWNLDLQNGKKWIQKAKRGDGFHAVQDTENYYFDGVIQTK